MKQFRSICYYLYILAGLPSILSVSVFLFFYSFSLSQGLPSQAADSSSKERISPLMEAEHKASLHTLAETLGIIAKNVVEEDERLHFFAEILTSLSFSPTNQTYYSIWQDNTLVYSPLLPFEKFIPFDHLAKEDTLQNILLLLKGQANQVISHVPVAEKTNETKKYLLLSQSLPHSNWKIVSHTPLTEMSNKGFITIGEHKLIGFFSLLSSFLAFIVIWGSCRLQWHSSLRQN